MLQYFYKINKRSNHCSCLCVTRQTCKITKSMWSAKARYWKLSNLIDDSASINLIAALVASRVSGLTLLIVASVVSAEPAALKRLSLLASSIGWPSFWPTPPLTKDNPLVASLISHQGGIIIEIFNKVHHVLPINLIVTYYFTIEK